MKTIESVSNSIIARAKLLKVVVNVSKNYFDAMSKYILGMNPQEHKHLSANFIKSEPIVQKLSEGVSDVTLRTLYTIYEQFSTMDASAVDFRLLFDNQAYSRASLSELSSGQHVNMRADINRAILAYDKYLSAGVDDDEIFNFSIAITKANHYEYYKFLTENHAPNKLTIELIRRLLPVVTGDAHLYITELINEQKRSVTNSTRVNVGTWDFDLKDSTKNANTLQGHECVIFRYGLTPSTISLPPGDLFKTLDWRWDDSKNSDQNFTKAAMSGVNIVLLTRTHGTPIEFDFRGVLDKSFAEKLPVKPLSGLNKNFLARYNTNSVLSVSAPSVSATNSASTLASTHAIRLYSTFTDTRFPVGFVVSRLNWSVVETIDGTHYRELGCTIQSVPNEEKTNLQSLGAKAGSFVTTIPGAKIMGLIMGASTMPTEYNSMHAENITKVRGDMFDPVAPSHISRYASFEKIVPASEPIKNEVVARFEVYARSRVGNVGSNRDWQNLFVSDEFVSAANEIISSVLIKNSLIDKLKSPEYTITQIARISAVVSKFLKSITRAGESMQERTFSEYLREDLNRMLVERFIMVVKKAADLMDSDKSWTNNEITLKEFIIAY